VIPRIQPDELHELARSWGFSLEAEEAEQLLEVAEAVFQSFDLLESQERSAVAPVDATRDPGRSPEGSEDPLNAIVRFCRVRAEGCEGMLSGTRVAVKDAVAIAGIPLTCGSRILHGYVPAEDSVVADRLLRAGAEVVAITNMDDFAFSGGGESSWYGPTRNPWDARRTAGGSSSGSAAALFYDGIDTGIGGDQGGSIRAPASWCGILGLKPTHGLVPYVGIAGIDQTFDHCGPLARTAADLAAVLQAIAGREEGDPRQQDVPTADYVAAVDQATDSLAGTRFGVVAEGFAEEIGVEPETAEAVRETTERLRALGAEAVDISLPEHLQAGGIAFIGFVEGMTNLMESGGNGYSWRGRYRDDLAPALSAGLREHAQALSPQMKVTLIAGRWLRSRYAGALYAKAQNLRPWLGGAYDRALADVDALILPTTPWRAHELAPEPPLADKVLRGWANLSNTYPTDMTGHPALSLPLAAADGLPVGVMLVGRHFDDVRLLSIAATCEHALGWAPDARGAPGAAP
jgi:amidase